MTKYQEDSNANTVKGIDFNWNGKKELRDSCDRMKWQENFIKQNKKPKLYKWGTRNILKFIIPYGIY